MDQTRRTKVAAQRAVLDRGELCHRSFSLLRQKTTAWRVDADGLWSYPALAPSHDGQVMWLMIISGVVPMSEQRKTAIFRPKAAVITKSQLPQVVRYECWRHGHDPFPDEPWDSPVAMFPHKTIGTLTPSGLQRRERELCGMYPSAQDEFVRTRTLPRVFAEAFLELTHPIFLKYLNALVPEFVRATTVQSLR
jgi:hypothetical protein